MLQFSASRTINMKIPLTEYLLYFLYNPNNR